MKRCHRCQTPWVSEATKTPGVKESCESCSAYLHCCLNCRFYLPSAHNECYIGTTEWVGDKEGANFCDEFEFKDEEAIAEEKSDKDAVKGQLDSLFGDSDTPSEGDALDRFKGLFGD